MSSYILEWFNIVSDYIKDINFKFYQIDNAIIEPYKHVLFKPLNIDNYRFTSHSYPKYDNTITNYSADGGDTIKTNYDDVFMIQTSPNYFHMMIESLPRLWGYHINRDENILINKNILDKFEGLYDILNQYLNFKNIQFSNYEVPKDRITKHRFHVKKLKMFASTNKDVIKALDDIKKLSVAFWQKYIQDYFKPIKPFRKIFINRTVKEGQGNNIRCGNQQEIYQFLKQYDYEILDPNKVNIKTAMRMCYEAKEIVGVHGAGLSNLLFCQPKIKFSQLTYKHPQEEFYKKISTYLNLNYKSIYGISKNGDEYANENELFYIKDLQKLV